MKICQAVLKLWSGHENCLHTKGNNSKSRKSRVTVHVFMCSARRLMVFNFCVKFHENMSSGFKVTERTRKLLTDTHTHTHTEKRRKHYTPMAYFVCRGYNKNVLSKKSKFLLLTQLHSNGKNSMEEILPFKSIAYFG